MLTVQKLNDLAPYVREAVEELVAQAKSSQTHPGDLLLVCVNAFVMDDLLMLGPGPNGLDFSTQFRFFDAFRRDALAVSNSTFAADPSLREFLVHVEMQVYLKIWEADFFIRQLYQLAQLAQGKPYDWSYEVPTHSRAGSKQETIRKDLRDAVRNVAPHFAEVVEKCYRTQIRNAIAHSQFSIVGDTIGLSNYVKGSKDNPLPSLSIQEWEDYIHMTLLLQNELTGSLNAEADRYRADSGETGVEIILRRTLAVQEPTIVVADPRPDHMHRWLQKQQPEKARHLGLQR